MSRRPPLPKRPDRSRLQTTISGDVHEQVDLYCSRYGITEARFFETAAREKLAGTGDAKSLGRQLKLLNEQLEIMSEHNHLFVQMWLRNTQLFTKEEQVSARPRTDAAYERFVRQIQMNLTGGGAFLSECRRQLRAAPTETPRAEATSPPNGSGSAAASSPEPQSHSAGRRRERGPPTSQQ